MAAYRELYLKGKLGERVEAARCLLEGCQVCPRHCGINRLVNQEGKCRTGRWAMVSSYGAHFGEEVPLVGVHGSGTIFFTNCNLHCLLCQNYTISQLGEGHEVNPDELAKVMLFLQAKGCHNINFVSPTHVIPQILEALEIAIRQGLSIPLVYNSGGYDSVGTLKLLDGIIDVYMPDMKYSDDGVAQKFSGVDSYSSRNQEAVREMHRQVGDLEMDENGIARRGLLVRHLVLPNRLAGTEKIVEFLAGEVSPNTYLNVMSQYHPCYRAHTAPELSRPLTSQEYSRAVQLAYQAGLTRLDQPRFSLRLI